MAIRGEMNLPAGVREAIDTLIQESVRCGLYDAPRKAQTAAHEALVARLLALLAPEPEPSDAEIKYVAETLYRDEFGYDASLIAAGDSDQLRYRHMARIALEAAARKARQTGGEG